MTPEAVLYGKLVTSRLETGSKSSSKTQLYCHWAPQGSLFFCRKNHPPRSWLESSLRPIVTLMTNSKYQIRVQKKRIVSFSFSLFFPFLFPFTYLSSFCFTCPFFYYPWFSFSSFFYCGPRKSLNLGTSPSLSLNFPRFIPGFTVSPYHHQPYASLLLLEGDDLFLPRPFTISI